MANTKKNLSDLMLLDRFLFAEAVEDPEIMQLILEIILEREVRLDGLPQTEKEERDSPRYRHVRLDVWARDLDNRVYDTEVQKRNTGNLPRRSRYYQSHIDVKLLEPGTVDFSLLGDVILILIAPFDLIGDGCYRYTFRMCCMENKERILEDGAVRIFLNTHGKNPKEVSPELVQLLHFMEHTNEAPPADGECEKVQRLRKKIEAIKSNEEVGVRFMQEWEERELERIDARKEGEKIGEERGEQRGLKLGEQRGLELGKQRGLMLGEQNKLRNLVQKKLAKNQSLEKIAEDLMEDLETIQKIADNLSGK